MRTFRTKLLALVILLMAGFTGLNAQYYRGNQYLRNQRGGCLNTSTLTAEQQAKVQELSTQHMAEMDALRTELRSTADPAGKIRIRAKMNQNQANHRVAIVELGVVPANIPHAGYYGRGKGAGYGRGAGIRAAAGRGAGGSFYGGRGLGPCGAGLGPRR